MDDSGSKSVSNANGQRFRTHSLTGREVRFRQPATQPHLRVLRPSGCFTCPNPRPQQAIWPKSTRTSAAHGSAFFVIAANLALLAAQRWRPVNRLRRKCVAAALDDLRRVTAPVPDEIYAGLVAPIRLFAPLPNFADPVENHLEAAHRVRTRWPPCAPQGRKVALAQVSARKTRLVKDMDRARLMKAAVPRQTSGSRDCPVCAQIRLHRPRFEITALIHEVVDALPGGRV